MSDIVSHRIIKSVDEEYEYPLNIWEERIYHQGRADAIEEFYSKCREKYWFSSDFMNYFDEVREQLKE